MKLFLLGALIFATSGCGICIKKEPDQVSLEENEQGEMKEKRTSHPVEVSVSVSIIPERRNTYRFPVQDIPSEKYLPGGPYVMLSY